MAAMMTDSGRRGPRALARGVQADKQGDKEGDGEDGTHETDRLGDRVEEVQRPGKALAVLCWFLRHSASN